LGLGGSGGSSGSMVSHSSSGTSSFAMPPTVTSIAGFERLTKSKGSMSLDEKAMKEWEERIKEAERRQQERRRRASGKHL
jgi:hypothetical protein